MRVAGLYAYRARHPVSGPSPMPATLTRSCRMYGCPGGPACTHARQPWQSSTPTKRITGRPLQRKRQQLFQREPLCRECIKRGLITRATIRDHIKPLAEGGTDDESNVQPICAACHDAKTATESQRGLRRSRG